jgi:hypothetical protein
LAGDEISATSGHTKQLIPPNLMREAIEQEFIPSQK